MVSKFLKKKSKRIPAKTRYKVEKKVRQHKKKLKKEAKKNPQKRPRKDPGIPNSLPFKEQILKEAEQRKIRLQEEQELLKEKRRTDRELLRNKKRNLESLVKDAQKKTAEFDKKKTSSKEKNENYTGGKAVENSLKTFYKEFRKVIDAADVILEVLDARDPLGSRCTQVEEAVISSGTNKKLVLVLNKIDLVPRENVEAWLKHLRNELPTIAFKASTQAQHDNLGQMKLTLQTVSQNELRSSKCLGADVLMKLLGNYCRSQGIRTSISVGVIGFPNTGKSSIINSLKRSKTCNVGSTPGVTKTMQLVHLDKHIKLLDSPGVVMARDNTDTNIILRNCVKLETLQDPVEPVEAVLRRSSKEQMMIHYKISDYQNTTEFLQLLARRFGRLKKGGIPDINKAARIVLQDWTSGKITYYTHPPDQHSLPSHVDAQVVAKMSEAFNIDDIKMDEEKILQGLSTISSKHMLIDSFGPATRAMEASDFTGLDAESDDENNVDSPAEEMNEDEDIPMLKKMTVSFPSSKHIQSSSGINLTSDRKAEVAHLLAGNVQLNKGRKQDFKRMKRERKKADVVAGQLSDALTGVMTIGGSTDEAGDYNFEDDFV